MIQKESGKPTNRNICNWQTLVVLPMFFGTCVFIFWATVYGSDPNSTDFDNMALGKETQIYRAITDNGPVHCDDLRDAPDCLESWKTRGGMPVTLWLGNSQLHAINQMHKNDVNAVQLDICNVGRISRSLDYPVSFHLQNGERLVGI